MSNICYLCNGFSQKTITSKKSGCVGAQPLFLFYAACSKIISTYRVMLSPARFAAACKASFCALRILSSTRAVRRSFRCSIVFSFVAVQRYGVVLKKHLSEKSKYRAWVHTANVSIKVRFVYWRSKACA